jgi:hypothetical protein
MFGLLKRRYAPQSGRMEPSHKHFGDKESNFCTQVQAEATEWAHGPSSPDRLLVPDTGSFNPEPTATVDDTVAVGSGLNEPKTSQTAFARPGMAGSGVVKGTFLGILTRFLRFFS